MSALARRARVARGRPLPHRGRAGAAHRAAAAVRELGRSTPVDVPSPALLHLTRARAPIRRAQCFRAAPHRRQSRLLARHSRSRRARADDVPGQEGGRRGLSRRAKSRACRASSTSIASANAPFPGSMPPWRGRCGAGEPVVLVRRGDHGRRQPPAAFPLLAFRGRARGRRARRAGEP